VNRKPSKISLPEAVIMILLSASIDIAEIFVDLAFGVPVVGQVLYFLNWVMEFFTTGITQIWLWLRGAKWQAALAGNIIEFIPFINILPIRTVSLILTIYLTNKAAKKNAPPRETIPEDYDEEALDETA